MPFSPSLSSQERLEEAAAIAATAVEVHGMMTDVSALVQEQAEGVNQVEAKVDETLERVQEGNKQLTKAAEYQKSYRKKLLLFALCCLALVGVIVIPIVIHYLPSLKASSSGSNSGGGGGGGASASASPSALPSRTLFAPFSSPASGLRGPIEASAPLSNPTGR